MDDCARWASGGRRAYCGERREPAEEGVVVVEFVMASEGDGVA